MKMSLFLSGSVTMILYAAHITRSGEGDILTFCLKLARGARFSLIIVFTACSKWILDALQGECVLYVKFPHTPNRLHWLAAPP